MSRLVVLAVTLSSLPFTGEAFMASSERTINKFNLPRYHPHEDFNRRSSHKRRGTRRILHEKPREDRDPAFPPSTLYSLTSYRRPPSLLKAALLNDSSSPGKSNRDGRRRRKLGADKKGPGWHRKIFGKMPWRRESDGLRGGSKSSSSSLTSSTMEHEEIMLLESFAVYENAHQDLDNDFMVQYFETSASDQVLPVVQVEPRRKNKFKSTQQSSSVLTNHSQKPRSVPKSPTIDSEYFDVSITQARPPEDTTQDTFSSTDGKRGVICRVLQNMLTERISERWTSETPEGLNINIRSSSDNYNNIGRLLFKGRYRADATFSSNRIVFDNIRFSSIRAEMEQVTLNLMGFFSNDNNNNQNPRKQKKKEQKEDQSSLGGRPNNTYSSSMPTKTTGTVRYPKQFDIHIEDLTMSRHDLLFSSCVRNGLRRLLIRLLKDRGLRSDSIRITSIDILPNGKISCVGEAKTHFASAPVRFEVRSGISFSNQGHVLTFPGLEVSLNRDIGLFVPVHPTLDLDVGHNTKFRSIIIDGRKKRLRIAASVTITPDRTRIMQDHVQNSDAFSALFSYDIGQWLTRLLRFSK